MTDSYLSSTGLDNTRKRKKNQRTGKLLLLVWRLVFLSSLAVGASCFVNSSAWMVHSSSEIEIEGNQKLSKQEVRSWLKIYPQMLWNLPIAQISKTLRDEPPLKSAKITREILPPKLTIVVKEREPVAIATTGKEQGFLDAGGTWIDRGFYPKDSDIGRNISLSVKGFNESYSSDWSKLYRHLPNSLIKIKSVDWTNPSNLILQTELGEVHIGAYNDKDFVTKILVLNKMKNLPSRLPRERIAYIDLSNPQKPTVQVIPEIKDPDKLP